MTVLVFLYAEEPTVWLVGSDIAPNAMVTAARCSKKLAGTTACIARNT
jgi:hypothetical protein